GELQLQPVVGWGVSDPELRFQERVLVTVSLAPARRAAPMQGVLVAAAAAVVLTPAAYAAHIGAAPFEALARTYPGADVAMLTAAVEALATLAAAMTVGALLWHVLAQRRSKGRPLAPEGVNLTVLRLTAATWLISALPLAV